MINFIIFPSMMDKTPTKMVSLQIQSNVSPSQDSKNYDLAGRAESRLEYARYLEIVFSGICY